MQEQDKKTAMVALTVKADMAYDTRVYQKHEYDIEIPADLEGDARDDAIVRATCEAVAEADYPDGSNIHVFEVEASQEDDEDEYVLDVGQDIKNEQTDTYWLSAKELQARATIAAGGAALTKEQIDALHLLVGVARALVDQNAVRPELRSDIDRALTALAPVGAEPGEPAVAANG